MKNLKDLLNFQSSKIYVEEKLNTTWKLSLWFGCQSKGTTLPNQIYSYHDYAVEKYFLEAHSKLLDLSK